MKTETISAKESRAITSQKVAAAMMHEAPMAYYSLYNFVLHANPNDFRTGFWELFSNTIVNHPLSKYEEKRTELVRNYAAITLITNFLFSYFRRPVHSIGSWQGRMPKTREEEIEQAKKFSKTFFEIDRNAFREIKDFMLHNNHDDLKTGLWEMFSVSLIEEEGIADSLHFRKLFLNTYEALIDLVDFLYNHFDEPFRSLNDYDV